jgi:hypothetical protein
MKSCFFLFCSCILFSMAASGQAIGSYVNAQPQMFVMPDHPQHASQTELAPEQDLRERSVITFGQGERPLWECMPEPAFVPIADLARTLRSQHVRAKKVVTFRND